MAAASPNGVASSSTPPGTKLSDWTTAVEKKDWKGMTLCGGVFTQSSSTYGQCIIDGRVDTGDMQVFIAKKMGGIAGGKKFVEKRILFKVGHLLWDTALLLNVCVWWYCIVH